MSTPPKRVAKKRKSKTKLFSVSFRNSKNCFHSAQQQKSQIRICSGSFSLTPAPQRQVRSVVSPSAQTKTSQATTDNSTGARSTADRRPRKPQTTPQRTPDDAQKPSERSSVHQHHSAAPTDKKGTPNKKGPKTHRKTTQGRHTNAHSSLREICRFIWQDPSIYSRGGTLLWDNRRLIGRSLIVLARQVQNNRN